MSRWFRTYGYAEVAENLIVGAYPLDAADVDMLRRVRVDRVFNLTRDEEYRPGEREAVVAALAAAGIVEARLRLVDHGHLPFVEIEVAVQHVLEWLEQGVRTYLHCRAGQQRSPSVAAGVIALREGVTIEAALERLRQRKPSSEPLPHQREELLHWWRERDRLSGWAATPAVHLLGGPEPGDDAG